MKEGEPVLGGPQANPGGMNTSNFGGQPPVSATPQPPQVPTQGASPVAPAAQPQPAFPPQATPQTPVQPIAPAQPTPTIPTRPTIQPSPAPTSFNNMAPRPQPNPMISPQPLSSGTGDIVLQKTKKKKGIIIGICTFSIICAITVAALLMLSTRPNQNSDVGDYVSKDELYVVVSDFCYGNYDVPEKTEDGLIVYNGPNNSYCDLLEAYDAVIGFDLSFSREEVLFPITDSWSDVFNKNYEAVNSAYKNFSKINSHDLSDEESQTLDNLKNSARKDLDTIYANVLIMSEFYEAFIAPIRGLYNDIPATCTKSEKISKLLDDQATSAAAEKYFSIYCEAIAIHDRTLDTDVLMAEISPRLVEAEEELKKILVKIEPDPLTEMSQFIGELENE